MQLQLPSATLSFSGHDKIDADHTINELQLSRVWRVQSDLFNLYAVHAN